MDLERGMTRGNELLAIGELAARTGLTVSAIRFYEEKGLVQALRSAGGQRRFLRSDIRRLSFALIAQRLGCTLPEIAAELAKLPQGRTPTQADWRRISNGFGRLLDERIAALQRMRETLDGCIGCGCLSLKKCALYNPGDRAGRRGPGPRYAFGERAQAET
ncbi:MAG: MerR family transcriptional regulator, redox-sensitive transcriptional activator SoxR [Sphingomonadales bacterium]|nr:MerR family transcriptional regulator, redox-sensitive transcriptional activator SoxR [Sphingomonadales bacterium]